MQGGGKAILGYILSMATTLHIRFASLFSATVIVGRAQLRWVAIYAWPVPAARRISVLQEGDN